MKIYFAHAMRGNPPHSDEKIQHNLERAKEAVLAWCLRAVARQPKLLDSEVFLPANAEPFSHAAREMGILDVDQTLAIDLEVLSGCDLLVVLNPENGEEYSDGVKGEIEMAEALDIPIEYFDYDG